MIPTKSQFQELTNACNSDRLFTSLSLIFGNETESRIRGIIEGCNNTLNTAFLNHVSPLPAYRWLSRQHPFLIAQGKAFPETDKNWLDNQATQVIERTEKFLESGIRLVYRRKAILQESMKDVIDKMQWRYYWIGHVSKCLCAYHYPSTPEMGKMREKCLETGQKIIEAQKAIHELKPYLDHMPWLPLPDHDFEHKLDELANLLQPKHINDLTPIKRVDSSFKERLFVAQLADGHARYLQRDDGVPSVIADLFYLKGFAKALDERTIRRICAEQQNRRETAKQVTAQIRSFANQQKRQADS